MALVNLSFQPEAKQLRQFGWVALAAFGALGGWALYAGRLLGFELGAAATPAGAGLVGLGALSAAFSAFAPRLNRPLFLALMVVAFPIGWGVSHAVLLVFYVGFVTPIGLLLRAVGRDPMRRRFEKGASTYWVRHAPVTDRRRYFRQF